MKEMQYYKEGLEKRKCVTLGSKKEIAKQHAKGRLTAREWLERLFDPGTFEEIDSLVLPRYENYVGGKQSRYGDGVVTGFGLINGRHAMVASQDANVMGGSLGEMHANKIVKAMRMALQYGGIIRNGSRLIYAHSDGRVKSPIPGLVAHIRVQVGDRVEAGQPILVLEAMKMENEIRAPVKGVVTAVHV